MNKKGLTVKAGKKPKTMSRIDNREEIISLLLQGRPIAEVTKVLGVTYFQVYYYARGLKLHKPGKYDGATKKKILKMLKQGYSQVQIANEIGTSKQYVNQIARGQR